MLVNLQNIANLHLKSSVNLYRTIINESQNAIIMLGEDGNILLWNNAVSDMFGYAQNDILNEKLDQLLIPEQFKDEYKNTVNSFIKYGKSAETGSSLEFKAIHHDGHEIPIELLLLSLHIKD